MKAERASLSLHGRSALSAPSKATTILTHGVPAPATLGRKAAYHVSGLELDLKQSFISPYYPPGLTLIFFRHRCQPIQHDMSSALGVIDIEAECALKELERIEGFLSEHVNSLPVQGLDFNIFEGLKVERYCAVLAVNSFPDYHVHKSGGTAHGILGASSPLALFSAFTPPIAVAWPGKVVEDTDVDTIVVIKGNKEVDVRLYGVDTPESAQPYGTKAKRFVSSMAGNERVEIDQKDRDQYGRVVGLVYIEGDGECLNEELVRAGYAWVYGYKTTVVQLPS